MKTATNFRLFASALAIFSFTLFSSLSASAQVNAAVSDVVDDLREYYLGPIQEGDYLLTMYIEKLDFETTSDEDLGYAILGGLLVAYDEAKAGDYIGVIIVNTNDQATSIALEKSVMKKYLKGSITVDEMIGQTFSTTIDLDDIEGLSQAGY
jgi:hypothetical protein